MDRDYGKYIVLKGVDIDKYLSPSQVMDLKIICRTMELAKRSLNHVERKYVVVQDNWPEYEKVWGMIEERADAS